ncbi:hypothetical protein M409DRAFT_62911 [Zasmidium cellare ATCC 36951]|uniref:DUF8212 domain-containing protein n=1 Tax=Zasmidium cellare ATCC 36951 TaxID=1080233 RepID=A0A6A6D0X9_ZASCE|nr:uncharacterized protein M409DRAFT_62911 [Zasmidium cellare ATCC 36951]KAF2172100.1 hypothetical protein M409DRAFT_62911 [Zasmidium cellare ATCC 36951]
MRLINTTTLELHTFYNRTIPRYATLSHCWAEDEVSLEDFNAGARDKAGIRSGLAWVDTCCIDKSSSAELSESINSMYVWYQKSVASYVFLEDVDIEGAGWMQDFADARWFTRGWTLQEPLAPLSVRFFDKNLQFIDTREGLAKDISRITRIPETLLCGMWSEYRTTSVACRMSWASHWQTTREEDMAYCLLGLFDVNMPLLYGEGKKAFRRLQEHIISSSTDDSVFAWISSEASDEVIHGDGLLACAPKDFAHSGNIVSLVSTARPPTTVTNKGVQVHYAITGKHDLRLTL